MIIIKIRKKVGRKKISIGDVIEVLFIKLKIYMFVIFIGDCWNFLIYSGIIIIILMI